MAVQKSPKTNRRKRNANTWKDIDQSVKPKAMSSASEKRIWKGRAKAAGAVVFLAALITGGVYLAPKLEGGPELLTQAGESLPLATIDIQTNGSLPESLILEKLDIPSDANLLSVDLGELKSRLESIGQVENVVVSRRFPDALEVTIVEREPIVRLLVQGAHTEKQTLYADKTGVVFKAERLDPSVSERLPFIFGIKLAKNDRGFSQIAEIEPLADLLSEARAIAPHLYSRWQVVSLEEENKVIAKGKSPKQVVFDRNSDFRDQLGRLDYILDDLRGTVREPLKSIDLTLGDQVPVTL